MPYIPSPDEDRKNMLNFIGASSVEELFETIPEGCRLKGELNLPPPLSEGELFDLLSGIAELNASVSPKKCLAGGGVYPHYIPAVVTELAHRAEFYTSYTPYQPEVSQGILQAMFEYQSYICLLTGMDASNASGYDGGTVLADAVVMAKEITNRRQIIAGPFIHPHAMEVLRTYNLGLKLEINQANLKEERSINIDELEKNLSSLQTAAVILQVPNFLGTYEENIPEIAELAHKFGALLVLSVNPFVLGVIRSPGALGADIVVGEGQPLGINMGFGGPLLGFIATKQAYIRKLPGRIIGEARAKNGKKGYVMTLQAREQHIRRQKASSNICTNEALMAITSAIYLSALGKQGFHKLARLCEENAHYAYSSLTALRGVQPLFPKASFFNEFAIRLPSASKLDSVYNSLLMRGWLPGIKLRQFYEDLEDCLLLCFTELHSKEIIDEFCADFEEVLE